jgi:hypothetical protein
VSAAGALAAVAVLAFLSQLVPGFLGGYGYFIDELYYLACARRLAWGYVDHPPLSIFLLRGETAVVGTSVWAIRLLPALAGATLALLTGSLARRLGGGAFAQGLAALATLAPPVLLVLFGFYSMNAFEPVLWLLAVLALVGVVESGDQRRWLWFGLVAGLGLLNKHTMVLLGAAALAGLLLTPERRLLASRWLWLAGLLALVLLLPNLTWQAQNGWPSIEFYRNAELYKNIPTPPLAGLASQVLFMNPLALPLWLAGLVFLFVSPAVRPYRFLAWSYLLLLALVLASRVSRADRIAGIYPVLLAAGAVATERAAARAGWGWLRGAAVALIVTGAVALAPLGLPVLPPGARALHGGPRRGASDREGCDEACRAPPVVRGPVRLAGAGGPGDAGLPGPTRGGTGPRDRDRPELRPGGGARAAGPRPPARLLRAQHVLPVGTGAGAPGEPAGSDHPRRPPRDARADVRRGRGGRGAPLWLLHALA